MGTHKHTLYRFLFPLVWARLHASRDAQHDIPKLQAVPPILPESPGPSGPKIYPQNQELPRQPNQREGQNGKVMNFAHFCEFWCFP